MEIPIDPELVIGGCIGHSRRFGLRRIARREFLALDARSGTVQRHFGAGAGMASSPMSYAVDGRQYIAVLSAGALFSFALPPEAGNKNQARAAKGTAVGPK
jgi:hypothetical protein